MSLADRKIVFLFPGQGAQYENMGSELIENNPVYAAAKEVLSEEVFEVIREGKKEALEKMKSCIENLKGSKYDNVYRTKFVVGRDIRIVEKILENM